MLKIQNVTKTYPNGTQALKDVSFDVKDGEFLVVIGLSGSGKSTLLRCINRLIDPTDGKIFWIDIDITAAPPTDLRNIRRKIGMVFQQFNLVKRSSVMTNVLSGRLGYVNPCVVCSASGRRMKSSVRSNPSNVWGSRIKPTTARMPSPADSSNAWALRARSCRSRS